MNDDLKKVYRSTRKKSIFLIAMVFSNWLCVELVKVYGIPSIIPLVEDKMIIRIVRYFLIGYALLNVIMIRVRKYYLSRRKLEEYLTRKGFIEHLGTSQYVTDCIGFSVSCLGMLLFFIGGRSLDFYPFMLVSLILLGAHYPRYSDWKERFGSFQMSTQNQI